MPPGPVSVTSRTAGDSSRSATAAMSPSRPISAVDVTGMERHDTSGRRGRCGTGRGRGEALAEQRGQVLAHETAELARRPERAIRGGGVRLQLGDHRRQSRLEVRSRRLQVDQPRQRPGEPELVLQAGDVHARPDPAVALPVEADEDVGLGEIGAVELLRRMRASTELEHHRRQPQRLDRPRHRRSFVGELGEGRADEDAQPLIRRANDIGGLRRHLHNVTIRSRAALGTSERARFRRAVDEPAA